jgi:hypothetical protein
VKPPVAVLAAALLLAACGTTPGPASASPESTPSVEAALNVRGTLDRGSAAACPSGEACDPTTPMYLVFSQPGRGDVRLFVPASGAFALHLDPGTYSISAAPPPMAGRLTPSTVRVPQQGAVDLQLVIR